MPNWSEYADEGFDRMSSMASNSGQQQFVSDVEDAYREYCESIGNNGQKSWDEFVNLARGGGGLDGDKLGGIIGILAEGFMYVGGDERPDDPAEDDFEDEGQRVWDGVTGVRGFDQGKMLHHFSKTKSNGDIG
jgi:hypothetical protein